MCYWLLNQARVHHGQMAALWATLLQSLLMSDLNNELESRCLWFSVLVCALYDYAGSGVLRRFSPFNTTKVAWAACGALAKCLSSHRKQAGASKLDAPLVGTA